MSFISVFDVLGPNMIGPSSSHTAGTAVIAYLAQKMINGPLKKVEFTLYGSFAKTYRGHGTDRALLGGIMGFSTDDTRIRDSFRIAEERGLEYHFIVNETDTDIYPNTVDIRMENDLLLLDSIPNKIYTFVIKDYNIIHYSHLLLIIITY